MTEEPIDFLVKHLLSSSEEQFQQAITNHFSFTVLCDFGVGLSEKENQHLVRCMIDFYHSRSQLGDLVKFLAKQECESTASGQVLPLILDISDSFKNTFENVLSSLEKRRSSISSVASVQSSSSHMSQQVAFDVSEVLKFISTDIDFLFTLSRHTLYLRSCLYSVSEVLRSSGQTESQIIAFVGRLLIQRFWCLGLKNPSLYGFQQTLGISQRSLNKTSLLLSKILEAAVLDDGIHSSSDTVSRTKLDKLFKNAEEVEDFLNTKKGICRDFLKDLSTGVGLRELRGSSGLDVSVLDNLDDPSVEKPPIATATKDLYSSLEKNQHVLDMNVPQNSSLFAKFYTELLKSAVLSPGWKLKKEHKNCTVSIKKRFNDSPFNLVMGERTIPAALEDVYEFLHDISSSFKLDHSTAEADVVQQFDDSRRLIRIKSSLPFPLADREVVFMQHDLLYPGKEAILAGHSVETDLCPPQKGIDRAFLLVSGYYLEAVADNQCKISYIIQISTNKAVPKAVIQKLLIDTSIDKTAIYPHINDPNWKKKKSGGTFKKISSSLSRRALANNSHKHDLENQESLASVIEIPKLKKSMSTNSLSSLKSLTSLSKKSLKITDKINYESIGSIMRSEISIKDQFDNRKLEKSCFAGSEAVAWFISNDYCEDETSAVTFGQTMSDKGVFWHVNRKGSPFVNDSAQFYRFSTDEGKVILEEFEEEQSASNMKRLRKNGQMIDLVPLLDSKLESAVLKIRQTDKTVTSLKTLCSAQQKLVEELRNAQKSNVVTLYKTFCLLLWGLSLTDALFNTSFYHLFFKLAITLVVTMFIYLCHIRSQEQAEPLKKHEDKVKDTVVSDSMRKKSLQNKAAEGDHISISNIVDAGSSVKVVREVLKKEYPEVDQVYSDSYLLRVLSVPNRTQIYAQNKLLNCLKWRREFGADNIDTKEIKVQLDCRSLYWYGYDNSGHPLLWVCAKNKDYRNINVEKELQMHVLMIEQGLKLCPEGIDSFVIIANSEGTGIRDFDLGLMKGLVKVVLGGFPDRLQSLYALPVNLAIKTLHRLLSPLMPARLLEKVNLLNNPSRLSESIPRDFIPKCFKGENDHPTFDESETDDSFSFERMLEIQRLNLELFLRNKERKSFRT